LLTLAVERYHNMYHQVLYKRPPHLCREFQCHNIVDLIISVVYMLSRPCANIDGHMSFDWPTFLAPLSHFLNNLSCLLQSSLKWNCFTDWCCQECLQEWIHKVWTHLVYPNIVILRLCIKNQWGTKIISLLLVLLLLHRRDCPTSVYPLEFLPKGPMHPVVILSRCKEMCYLQTVHPLYEWLLRNGIFILAP